MPITSLSDLQQHLRWAIQLEHSTIAPYLYAYFSFKDAGSERPPEAARVIKDIVVEEMLHLALAGNVYNALGGDPLDLTDPYFFPAYPGPLPHHRADPPLILRLERASLSLIGNTFMAIEKPESVGAIPEGDSFGTIGQFYKAIQIGLEMVNDFPGDPSKQVTRLFGYGGGRHGHLIRVIDLYSATLAIKEIVDQGEGSAHTEYGPDGDLAHYWRLSQIVDGSIPFQAGDVYPVVPDPKILDLPEGPLRDLGQLFSDSYSLLLRALSRVYCVGDSCDVARHGAIYTLMARVLRPVAGALVQTPIPGTACNAGPSFERRTTPQKSILENATRLADAFPGLQSVPRALAEIPLVDE